MSSKPVYVVAGPGPVRDACASITGQVAFIDPPVQAALLVDEAPGVVIVDPEGLSAAELLRVTRELKGPDWTVALVAEVEPLTVCTLSSGYATGMDGVRRYLSHPGGGGEDLLALHRVLDEISRARHDINNPLTSALAETQLLLLDAPGGELREGLEAVQGQLRRIRDLVAATRHMRLRR